MGVRDRPLVCGDLRCTGDLEPCTDKRGANASLGRRAIVLLFNTAAILAMLRHYREDRDFMYGLDIKFLDEAKGRRG